MTFCKCQLTNSKSPTGKKISLRMRFPGDIFCDAEVQASVAGKFLYGLYFTAAAAILAFPCSATSAAFSVVAIIALFAHSSHAGSTATRTRPFITICSRASARTITNGTFAVTVACAASRTTGARIPSRHLTFLYYRDGPVIDLALSFFLFPHMFLADNGNLCQPVPMVGPNMWSVWHKQAG